MKQLFLALLALAIGGLFPAPPLRAQTADDPKAEEASLAMQLHNPVAALIRVPIENDWDYGSGSGHDSIYQLSLNPVVPFQLSEDWNLITRTLIPVAVATSSPGHHANTAGLSDLAETIYFSPDQPMGGWFWGAGPGLIFPSATDRDLGAGKWSAGPTAALLRQEGGWTLGVLTGHAWSFAGDRHRDDVSTTFLQPFVSYTTKHDTTFGVDTTSEYDWTGRQWTVPVEASVSQVLHLGGQEVEVGLTGRYYAERPADGPHWGLNLSVTFLFPKRSKTS